MTDWATEEARKIVVDRSFDSDTGQRNKERIAQSLRKAKADGMREAANVMKLLRKFSWHDKITQMEFMADRIEHSSERSSEQNRDARTKANETK